MKRILILLACAAIVVGCTSESKLPNPTGKGSVRAINAIPASPEVTFLIEERGLGSLSYKTSSAPSQYDDFDYSFNFQISVPGEAQPRRIASIPHKVETGKNHTFLLTGTLDAPVVTVLTDDIRTFVETDTVFELRFAHAIQGAGDVDLYIDPAGIVPSPGQQVATLAFGRSMAARDFEAGVYVITITAAGDVNTVLYQSREETFLPRTAQVVTAFQGDGNDTAPVALTAMSAAGGPRGFPDARYPSTVRFIHAAYSLPVSDIYDDEALTNRVVSDHDFGTFTGDIPVIGDTLTYRYTPAGSTAAILFEDDFAPIPGRHNHYIVVGDVDTYEAFRFSPDRAPYSTAVRFRIFHAALNQPLVDLYVLDADTPLDDAAFPRFPGIPYSVAIPVTSFKAGGYDLYVTGRNDKVVLAGPFRVDAADGDIVDLVLLDTADPNVLQILDVPVP